jgi:hypothetical protein
MTDLWGRGSRGIAVAWASLMATGALPSSSAAQEPVVTSGVRMAGGETSNAVRRAVRGARQRLENPACLAVLAEFQDQAGRSLESVLAEKALTAQEHFDQVLFYDGSDQRVCATPTIAAVTLFGSRVVVVCPAQFRRLAKQDSREAEFVVIHEVLHTLGLPENPPTPAQIRQRIVARCDAQGPRTAPAR